MDSRPKDKRMRPDEIINKGLEELGYKPGEALAGKFITYLEELKRWNRAYNLTSLKTDEDIIIRHFLDSALYLKVLEAVSILSKKPPVAVADVGSGAGFPGIPIKLLKPALKFYLIEPSRKKSAFLRHIIKTLGLSGIEVLEKRVEDVRGMEVDVALTRALFKTADFIKKAGHIVKKDGFFVLSKGPAVKEELKDIGVRYELITLDLPLSGIKRRMVLAYK